MMLWRAILTWLRSLFARPNPTVRRLERLRAVYRVDTGLYSRRVRDILRGQVAPEYHTHYDRLLRIELLTADLLDKDVRPAIPDLLPHVRALTERVVRLIEQLQRGDQLMTLYSEGSPERAMVADARQQVIAWIDEAMALQESVPARLIQLSASATGRGRDFDRLRDTLADLNARLEGMAEGYEHLSIEALYEYNMEEKQ